MTKLVNLLQKTPRIRFELNFEELVQAYVFPVMTAGCCESDEDLF